MNLKAKAKDIKQNIVILIVALSKKQTPWYAKMCVAITIAYALSPIDLIPDFIPVLGYLDDIIILPLLILLSIKLIPKNVIENCQKESDSVNTNVAKKWYFAIPIVLIWVGILIAIIFAVKNKFFV